MNPAGKWEGKLLDMSGPVALLTLDLYGEGDALSGDFTISFLSPEDDGCYEPSRGLAQTGKVSGGLDPQTGRVQLNYEVTIGPEAVAVTFDATITKADPHARRALLGCYSVGEGAGDLTLEGGGCVLWLYAEPRQAKSKRRRKNG